MLKFKLLGCSCKMVVFNFFRTFFGKTGGSINRNTGEKRHHRWVWNVDGIGSLSLSMGNNPNLFNKKAKITGSILATQERIRSYC